MKSFSVTTYIIEDGGEKIDTKAFYSDGNAQETFKMCVDSGNFSRVRILEEYGDFQAWKEEAEMTRKLTVIPGEENCNVESGPTGDILPATAIFYHPDGDVEVVGIYDYMSNTGFIFGSEAELEGFMMEGGK